VGRLYLLTGDNPTTASAVAVTLGLDGYRAGLSPADKAAAVRRLGAEDGPVAMVGDGVNDAPALAAASVGIAMGAAGTDQAIEAADIALMNDDLRQVRFTLRLGRRAVGVVRQNIALALGIKAAALVLAAAGFLPLWLAVLADTGNTVLVVANALRLLGGR
jgi:Cd2+/Zn2+-exporting ATPase